MMDRKQIRDKITSMLGQFVGGLTRSALARSLNLVDGPLDESLRALEREGQIKAVMRGGYKVYKLSTLAIAIMLAVGCRSLAPTGIDGVGVAKVGREKDHIATSPCIDQDAVAAVARVAIPVLIAETERQGFLPANSPRGMGLVKGLDLCLIPEPASCCVGTSCAGPLHELNPPKDGLYRWIAPKKSGCAYPGYAWASKTWPGPCPPEWPGEPHCASSPDPSYDWRATLIHEIGNVIRMSWLQGEGYTDAWISRYYQPGGPIDLAQKALPRRY